MNDVEIPKDSLQETMLGPLWARATYGRKYPSLLKDDLAIEIVEKITHDMTATKKFLSGKNEFRALGILVRARQFDKALKKYMEEYPEATVINLGAGLDTTFFRVDNGTIKWYDLDLPDAIEFRKQYIPEGPRNKCVSKSILDLEWFKDIEWIKEKGVFFIAGGLVYYFKEEEIKNLFCSLATRFPGGEIIFDAMSKLAVKKFNREARKIGKEKAAFFSVKNPINKFPQWSEQINVKDWHLLWKRTAIDPNWDKHTIKMIKLSTTLKTSMIIRLKFL
ncbi:MAG: class I SAM-dependent methyltransferase [Promethearchaeota archaeon]